MNMFTHNEAALQYQHLKNPSGRISDPECLTQAPHLHSAQCPSDLGIYRAATNHIDIFKPLCWLKKYQLKEAQKAPWDKLQDLNVTFKTPLPCDQAHGRNP